MIAKCGCNCSRCPSYRENLKTFADREYCSRGWEKYLEIKLKPEKLKMCDGCDIPDKSRKISYLNCRIRKCAKLNGIKNCAYCSEYPCPDVSDLHIIQKPNARKKIEKRIGRIIPEEDYLVFVEPYEGLRHLDEIRKLLGPVDIVKMTPVILKNKVGPFPDDLFAGQIEKSRYQQIHDILSTVERKKNISFARQVFLEKNRKKILKLLWSFGRYGKLGEGEEDMILDSEIYSAQKITAYFTRIHEYFRILENHGLSGEIIPVDERVWRTAGGALRKKGWYMRLTSKKRMSEKFFNALIHYTELLDKKYKKNAFGYFSRADMRVLRKDDKV